MLRQSLESASIVAAITVFALVASSSAQDYDAGEGETAITGLSGLSGFSGLSGLANGMITGYAPVGSGSDSDGIIQGERGLASEGSEAETGDYDDDSNESAASEEHPILSKFFNLISGVRNKRSVDLNEAPTAQAPQVLSRVKRGSKGWTPYVSTYVKTDKKANFKWGVSGGSG